MRMRLLVAAVMFGAVAPVALAAPPGVFARAYIVVNTDTNEVLAALQPDKRMAMASTTKLMTAIVTMKNAKLTDVATVPARAVDAGDRRQALSQGSACMCAT